MSIQFSEEDIIPGPDGGAIIANPIAFTIVGHQCIAIAADRVLYVFSL